MSKRNIIRVTFQRFDNKSIDRLLLLLLLLIPWERYSGRRIFSLCVVVVIILLSIIEHEDVSRKS